MNTETIQALAQLNNAFYRDNCESFSQTRQTPWQGWAPLCDHLEALVAGRSPVRVLDIGCGNMRFERYLLERFPHARFAFTCADSCRELAVPLDGVAFQMFDIVQALLSGERFRNTFGNGFDVVVAFGVAHHIPSFGLRREFVAQLAECACGQGVLALSFWQFADDRKLLAKALKTTGQACEALGVNVEEGDYFLGWRDRENSFRYCHSFTDEEVDCLAAALNVKARYTADRNNLYLIA